MCRVFPVQDVFNTSLCKGVGWSRPLAAVPTPGYSYGSSGRPKGRTESHALCELNVHLHYALHTMLTHTTHYTCECLPIKITHYVREGCRVGTWSPSCSQ